MIQKKLSSLYKNNKRFARYFIMAVIVAGIELALFQAIYLLLNNYVAATTISLIAAVALNWIGGRMFIFGVSKHHLAYELILIFIANLVGLIIQLVIISICVQLLDIYPLIGKILSVIGSFFWSFWFRNTIIYGKKGKSNLLPQESVTSIALFLIGGIIASIIFYLRFPNNFTEPNFYAEDGGVFFQAIYDHGLLEAMFTPFNGYFVVGMYLLYGLSFIVNLVFFEAEILNMAKSFAIVSYVFLGFISALPILLFRRYISKYGLALILFLGAFIPLPGSDYAIIGVIGNHKFVFVYIAFLLLIYRNLIPSTSWRRFILIDLLLLICAYTNVVIYLMLPFALIRYIPLLRTKKIKRFFQDRSVRSLIGLGILLLPQLVHIKLFGIPVLRGYLDAPYQSDATINLFIYQSYLFPFLGFSNEIMNDIIVIITFIILNIVLWFGLRHFKIAYIFGVATVFFITFLFVMNRTGISEIFPSSYPGGGPNQFFFTQNFIICFLVAIAVSVLIAAIPYKKIRLVAYVLPVIFIVVYYIPSAGSYGRTDFMQRTVKNIYVNAQAQCTTTKTGPITIQAYPQISNDFLVHNIAREQVCTPDLYNYVPDTEYSAVENKPGSYIPDLEAARLTQTFKANYDGLSGISIIPLTYSLSVKDHYVATILTGDCKTELHKISLNSFFIKDALSYRINFPRINHSKGKNYCLRLSLEGQKTAALALSLSVENVYPEGELVINGANTTTDLIFRLHYSR